jgi:GAF domain-containing protein
VKAKTHRYSLGEVLITEKLKKRTSRARSLSEQNRAFHRLARAATGAPREVLQLLLELLLQLCGAASAGISLLESGSRGSGFRWVALAGKLKPHLGKNTPRVLSPSGVTLDAGKPQLFCQPELYFGCLQAVQPSMVEALGVPFYDEQRPLGIIWIASHDNTPQFDMEDVKVVESFGGFAAFAIKLLASLEGDGAVPGKK